MSFVPADNPAGLPDATVANDGFFPDLTLSAFRADMGLGSEAGNDRLTHLLTAAMIEINESLSAWRAELDPAVITLDGLPATHYDGESVKLFHYRAAVHNRAGALMLETRRDYDSTKSGHDKAEALEQTADDYFRASAEAIARLTDRPRSTVELI